jgi:hypothetical protein
VKIEQPDYVMPKPRHAYEEQVVVVPPRLSEDEPRVEVEALAMLSSLASEFDY